MGDLETPQQALIALVRGRPEGVEPLLLQGVEALLQTIEQRLDQQSFQQ